MPMIIEGPEQAFKKHVISRKTIVKANDAMIHKNRTKAIRDLATRLSEKRQAEILKVKLDKNIFGDPAMLAPPVVKFDIREAWSNIKGKLSGTKNKK